MVGFRVWEGSSLESGEGGSRRAPVAGWGGGLAGGCGVAGRLGFHGHARVRGGSDVRDGRADGEAGRADGLLARVREGAAVVRRPEARVGADRVGARRDLDRERDGSGSACSLPGAASSEGVPPGGGLACRLGQPPLRQRRVREHRAHERHRRRQGERADQDRAHREPPPPLDRCGRRRPRRWAARVALGRGGEGRHGLLLGNRGGGDS
ncbi:hypothetical protein ACFSTC_25210 [Nonomuraea ferruginea]